MKRRGRSCRKFDTNVSEMQVAQVTSALRREDAKTMLAIL